MASIADPDGYVSIAIDLTTAVDRRGLWLCVAQLENRGSAIWRDESSPKNVSAITELLGNGSGASPLMADAQGGQIPLVICPEFAFGSPDWLAVDAAVDGFPGPIIFAAGFGATNRHEIARIEAAAATRAVTIHRGWTQDLTTNRDINIQCIWIRDDLGHRHCILVGKNQAQAADEDVHGVYTFSTLTEVVLNDMRILPFICADLLPPEQAGAQRAVSTRITNRAVESHETVLVLGSLLQGGGQASPAWSQAINRLITNLGTKSAALAIANVANEKFDDRDGGEIWRNLSGVYVASRFANARQRKAQEATDYFDNSVVMGFPVRSTSEQFVLGGLFFPPYSAVGASLHPWKTPPQNARLRIAGSSPILSIYERSSGADDLMMMSQVTHRNDPGGSIKLDEVSTRVAASNNQAVATLIEQLLFGPFSSDNTRAYESLTSEEREGLFAALYGLDTILSTGKSAGNLLEWTEIAPWSGQVRTTCDRAIPISLWLSTKKLTATMLVELRDNAFRRVSPPVMVSLGRGADGDMRREAWKAVCVRNDQALPEAGGFEDLATDSAASVDETIIVDGMQRVMAMNISRESNPPQAPTILSELLREIGA